jgi:hypothetical protein
MIQKSEYFAKKYSESISPYSEAVFFLNEIILGGGFPVEKEIKAEKSFRINIEVRESFSIIYVGFATLKHDINLKIVKIVS